MYAKTTIFLCGGNKDFVKYQAQGGVNPKPPLRTPLWRALLPQIFSVSTVFIRVWRAKFYTKNTNAKFGASYKRGLRFLCLYARGHM